MTITHNNNAHELRIFLLLYLMTVTLSVSATLKLSKPTDYQVIQRFTKDKGMLEIEGITEGYHITDLEGRFRGVDTTGVWGRIPASLTGSTFRGAMVLPAGGWYILEIRALNRKEVIAEASVAHVGVGEIFIVAGQSNPINWGEERQTTKTGMVSAFDGKNWQPAHDPQPGSGGNGGSFIPLLGDALAGYFDVPIGFAVCDLCGTSVKEWLPAGTEFPAPPTVIRRVKQLPKDQWVNDGQAFDNLTSLLQNFGAVGFRAVLWHQGGSDTNQPDPKTTLPGYHYWQFMEKMITETRNSLSWNIPWFVAQATYHIPDDESSLPVRVAQRALWESGVALQGPDTDALKGDMRENNGKGVHFSAKGLKEHASLWFEKIAPWIEKTLQSDAFSKPLPLTGEIFPVKGHLAFIILPGKITNPQPWVWYAPTLPGTPGPEEKWMFERFTAAGIAVAGIDVGESSGSPDGRALFTALYQTLIQKFGFSTKPLLLGKSRGGLMILNWAAENPERTSGFAGIYPVCDITSYPGIKNASPAYGMPPSELEAKLKEHNPVDRLEPLARAGVPLFAIHGDVDVLVPLEKNSGEVKKRYDALGGKMMLIVPKGQGHNMWKGFFQSHKLMDFVIRHAKQ